MIAAATGAVSTIVPEGPDVADQWIAAHCGPGDVVVTGDIPLADRCLKAGAQVVQHDGEVLTMDYRQAAAHLHEAQKRIASSVHETNLKSDRDHAAEHAHEEHADGRRDRVFDEDEKPEQADDRGNKTADNLPHVIPVGEPSGQPRADNRSDTKDQQVHRHDSSREADHVGDDGRDVAVHRE